MKTYNKPAANRLYPSPALNDEEGSLAIMPIVLKQSGSKDVGKESLQLKLEAIYRGYSYGHFLNRSGF